jgi:V/A-type H+/Na+-transporting ATPase subunit F
VSRLVVIIRPELVAGFSLAGVQAFPAADIETAVEFIEGVQKSGESCLLAIDDGLLAKIPSEFIRRMEAAEHMPFIAIPSGRGLEEGVFRRQRISELTRRAIGFHSIFTPEEPERKEK